MNKVKYKNKKTGKLREGFWQYNWAGGFFWVKIHGPMRKVCGEKPEYGDWVLCP